MQLGRKLFPPCRGTAINCLSGNHFFLCTVDAPFLPAHRRRGEATPMHLFLQWPFVQEQVTE